MKLKIAIYAPRKSAQRINYYNALTKYVDLYVVSDQETPTDILKSFGIKKYKFNNIILKTMPILGYMGIPLNVIQTFKKYNFDLIIIEQLFSPTGYILSNYLHSHNIKFIANADGGFPTTNKKSLKYSVKKVLMSKPDLWITSGRAGVLYLKSYGVKVNKIKTFIFSPYFSYDQPKFLLSKNKINLIKKKLGIIEKKIILSVGRQVYDKGFDILLKAVSNIQNNSLAVVIVGGEPTNECKQIIDKIRNCNIYFPGLLNKQKLSMYYSVANVFVFPTRHDVYGFPIIEALTYGCPIISSDMANAGVNIIKPSINGYIFKNEDVDDLKKKINNILENRNKANSISHNNFKLSKIYTCENMAKSIYNIIINLIDEKND